MEYHNFTYKTYFSFINSDNKGIGYYRLIYIIFVQSTSVQINPLQLYQLLNKQKLIQYQLSINMEGENKI